MGKIRCRCQAVTHLAIERWGFELHRQGDVINSNPLSGFGAASVCSKRFKGTHEGSTTGIKPSWDERVKQQGKRCGQTRHDYEVLVHPPLFLLNPEGAQ